jgi:hypothetical protein
MRLLVPLAILLHATSCVPFIPPVIPFYSRDRYGTNVRILSRANLDVEDGDTLIIECKQKYLYWAILGGPVSLCEFRPYAVAVFAYDGIFHARTDSAYGLISGPAIGTRKIFYVLESSHALGLCDFKVTPNCEIVFDEPNYPVRSVSHTTVWLDPREAEAERVAEAKRIRELFGLDASTSRVIKARRKVRERIREHFDEQSIGEDHQSGVQ